MTSRAYGVRSPGSYYDVIFIVTSFATELVTPTITGVRTDGRTDVRTPYRVYVDRPFQILVSSYIEFI